MPARRVFLLLVTAAVVCAHMFAQAPQRIVSTAPSITELLYALGLGDRVVGVDRFSHYPPAAASKPQVGDYASPDLETIASLRPDLVIIPTNPVRLKERLEALRLKVLELDQEGIPALFRSFAIVGKATGTSARAAELTATVEAQLDVIRKKAAGRPRTRIMFVVGRTPNRLDGLIVMGRASYLNEIIDIAGGENVFRDANAAYPQVSLEEVLARNPDVIVDMGEMSQTAGVTEAQKRAVEALWQRMGSLAAVKAGRVHAVASDVFVEPGPRVVDAAEAFFELLHPEGK
jgi:ABC-type Fe3+-hydroxamate transport system substrate-binding protein